MTRKGYFPELELPTASLRRSAAPRELSAHPTI